MCELNAYIPALTVVSVTRMAGYREKRVVCCAAAMHLSDGEEQVRHQGFLAKEQLSAIVKKWPVLRWHVAELCSLLVEGLLFGGKA